MDGLCIFDLGVGYLHIASPPLVCEWVLHSAEPPGPGIIWPTLPLFGDLKIRVKHLLSSVPLAVVRQA